MLRVLCLAAVLLFVLAISGVACLGRGDQFGLGGKDVRKKLQPITAKATAQAEGKKESYTAGDYGRTLNVKGVERTYEIHVPASYAASKPAPVVLVFHGGGGYPSAVAHQSSMDAVSDREGFLAVYPAGSGTRWKDRLLIWNDGRDFKEGGGPEADDVGFVVAMLDDLAGIFNVDKSRVYSCGISNGAQFSYLLSKKIPDRLAAIATIGGQRPAEDQFGKPSRPISVMQFSGKEDIYAPYQGGEPHQGKGGFKVKVKTKLESVPDVIKSWVKFNGCAEEPAESKRENKAIMTLYGPGKENTEVVLWTLEDGGHTWPGGQVFPSEVASGVGNVNKDINASEEMWKFFKRHERK